MSQNPNTDPENPAAGQGALGQDRAQGEQGTDAQRRTGPDTGKGRGSDLPSSAGSTQRDTRNVEGDADADVEAPPGRDTGADDEELPGD